MISGFYMALVLNEKYIKENSSYSLFISNRLLRLYPIYWVVLALTLLASVTLLFVKGYPLKLEAYLNQPNMTLGTCLVLIWTNLLLVGQDAIMFLGMKKATGALYWTTDFRTSSPMVYNFLFVHQAWSLSIEILFYLLAPFLMRRHTAVLVLLTAASIGLRLYLYRLGLRDDPWSYRFFPCELAFFFIGGLAYRAYAHLKSRVISPLVLRGALALILLFTLTYQFMPATHLVQGLYYLSFAIALPFCFILTKKSKWDYKIGELSYPVYISHLLVLLILYYLTPKFGISANLLTGSLIVITILFSALLVRFVADPVEVLRQRRVKKAPAVLTAPAV